MSIHEDKTYLYFFRALSNLCKFCLNFTYAFVFLKFKFIPTWTFVSFFWKNVSLQTPGNVTKRENLTGALSI